MSTADQDRIESLFDAAQALEGEEREAYLQRACAGDDDLRRQVESLLEAAANSEAYFSSLLGRVSAIALSSTEQLAHEPSESKPGQQVGPYTLIELIGAGGMGEVWRAQRTDRLIERFVALKLPHGTWQRRGLAERMSQERAILGTLDHPHIARLLDTGVTEIGQPYLAIEYVEGMPIDRYCREHAPRLSDKLSLFLQVVDAVAYAHGKLIVHRDLKPQNILVTSGREVRLLDFGIAKLLAAEPSTDSPLTQLAGKALTPDYAAPEQILGEPVTVAADVYSLGVLLFELLTGERPYKLTNTTRAALEEAIVKTHPSMPSRAVPDVSTSRALRGDLDTIVMKALKKDPRERYATAHALAEDVTRYIERRPVLARPDSAWYWTRKFVQRHRAGVAGGIVLAAAIAIGAASSIWQARVAIAERERAEEVKNFIASIFSNANPFGEAGQSLRAAELLQRAYENVVDSFSDRPQVRVELLNIIGSSLLGAGDAERADEVSATALQHAERGLAPGDTWLLRSMLLRAEAHFARGRKDEMATILATVERSFPNMEQSNPEELVRLLIAKGDLGLDRRDQSEANRHLERAVQVATARFGGTNELTVRALMLHAESAMITQPRPADSIERGVRAVHASSAFLGDSHPRTIEARGLLGRLLTEAGRVREGVEQLQAAADALKTIVGEQHPSYGMQIGNLAGMQRKIGDIEGSLESTRIAGQIFERQVTSDATTTGLLLQMRGVTLAAARRGEDALRDLNKAEEILIAALGEARPQLLTNRANRAHALALVGRTREAESLALSMVEAYPKSMPDYQQYPCYVLGIVRRLDGDHAGALEAQRLALSRIKPGELAEWDEVRVYAEIGLNELELGNDEAASAALLKAQTLIDRLDILPHPASMEVRMGLARLHLMRGDVSGALTMLNEVHLFWQGFDPTNRAAGEAAYWLAQAYIAGERQQEAQPHLSRARDLLARSPLPLDAKLLASLK